MTQAKTQAAPRTAPAAAQPRKALHAALAAAFAVASFATCAQDLAPPPLDKRLLPELEGAKFCPRGYATTYTVQCDPGSRSPIQQIWMPVGVGLEICTATQPICEPIRNFNPNARPGFEVMDSSEDDLVIVGFGLDRLIGVAP